MVTFTEHSYSCDGEVHTSFCSLFHCCHLKQKGFGDSISWDTWCGFFPSSCTCTENWPQFALPFFSDCRRLMKSVPPPSHVFAQEVVMNWSLPVVTAHTMMLWGGCSKGAPTELVMRNEEFLGERVHVFSICTSSAQNLSTLPPRIPLMGQILFVQYLL